ncbi:CHAT domain-containing protein [uncultured Aquimarina sp.]|uniref:CHAT domain-containing protein n=1 Tax=uncultured Aquimarina sp. TaxID=575652 RepID=UPI002627C7B8|nr:CHAT domain-containing protein [uncultured Aquimarina sp.]
MTKTAKLFGKKIDVNKMSHLLPEHLKGTYELGNCIEVSSTRSSNEAIKIDFDDTDLLAIQFTDKTEWIGHLEDIQEIYDTKTQSSRSAGKEDYVFEPFILSKETSRGSIKQAAIKLFSVFKPKNTAATTIKVLGAQYDKKVQPEPGLYCLDANMERRPYDIEDHKNGRYLLLLHGTLSTAQQAFGELIGNGVWQELVEIYKDKIIALEHETLSKSPLDNALTFLENTPKNCEIDILSHSRGGLVADILAKCDYRNRSNGTIGFSDEELSIVRKNNKSLTKTIAEINKKAEAHRLYVNKVVRVASPSSGTTILSRRVDHFFNLLLNAISLSLGVSNPLYGIVKSFLLELLAQKEDPEVLPGLNSMMPESAFQQMMNSGISKVQSELYCIAGDAEVGGFNFESLKVILANLFYFSPNDLVVDTQRMYHGIQRNQGMFFYESQNSDTNHFKYFSNPDTSQAIVEALSVSEKTYTSLFKRKIDVEGDRGVLLKWFSMKSVSYKPTTYERDVVIIIPGIMGSALAEGEEELWVQFKKIKKGAIATQLNISNDKIRPSGVIEKYYDSFAQYLNTKYDVVTLEFDWRLSISKAADELKKVVEEVSNASKELNVHIVAHSMGGLVVRQCMMAHLEFWEDYQKNNQNKFVMLGTPWLGSYLIMEVLTGHSGRVKQLAMLDFKHNRKELLRIFWKYKGVFELLPIEDTKNRPFWQSQFWDELKEDAKIDTMPNPKNNQPSLHHFEKYREEVLSFLEEIYNKDDFFKNIYYICGNDDRTVFDYRLGNRTFSSKKKLIYKSTSRGDGSVTWDTGIPKPLIGSKNLYYANATHGSLADEEEVFKGVGDILEIGSTTALVSTEFSLRSEEIITEGEEYPVPLFDSDEVFNTIFGGRKVTSKIEPSELRVDVIHGDLKASSFPVMVGHFFMDLILSAEKALDSYLGGRLSQRMGIGYYPGKIGESEVFFNLLTKPKGAIICGLGLPDELTSFLLAKTVNLAVRKYAMFMRDNYTLPRAKQYSKGLSFVMIGIGYGKLSIEQSIKGILLGVTQANNYIKKTNHGLRPIENVEIVNYYQSLSSQAYFCLNRIQKQDERIKFKLHPKIIRMPGAKRRHLIEENPYTRWSNLHIACVGENRLEVYTSNNQARVEKKTTGIGIRHVKHLLDKDILESSWNTKLSKTLFEMLIPNDFKNIFRDQNSMVVKLDKCAAQIPWELLHDRYIDKMPASVMAGFIRQLITKDSYQVENAKLNNNNVLVVGDPLYNRDDLKPLIAAKIEAEWVVDQMRFNSYKPNPVIRMEASDILKELFNYEYKMLHFAGHGVYNPEKGEIGIAIGGDLFIDPGMIKQLSTVPEFVFINCCYSGALNAEDDKYYKSRYSLAADVGTQLIEMGVKAIVISGWAVNDAAAKTFAETFYNNMFMGYNFGQSVQKARMSCYQNHSTTNTWGAYQCYGNPFYKFNNNQGTEHEGLEYVISDQIHTDMDNLLVAIRDQEHNTSITLEKLDNYLHKARQADLLDAVVIEKEALIYDELGMENIALSKFKELFLIPNGNFSICALQHYCTIKSYHLTSESVEDDLNEIKKLCLLGRNPKRLNIVANAYKMASLLFKDTPKKQIESLEKAFSLYTEAFEIASGDIDDGDYLDAITNLIFVGYILELRKSKTLIERLSNIKTLQQVSNVKDYLLQLQEKLRNMNTVNFDVSIQIGITETQYSLMLLNNDFKVDPKIDIIKTYQNVFQLLYSPRYINIEIRQIDFLLHYMEDETLIKQLKSIQTEIRKMLNRETD